MCVCVCVSVWQTIVNSQARREREGERRRGSGREREGEGVRERERKRGKHVRLRDEPRIARKNVFRLVIPLNIINNWKLANCDTPYSPIQRSIQVNSLLCPPVFVLFVCVFRALISFQLLQHCKLIRIQYYTQRTAAGRGRGRGRGSGRVEGNTYGSR